MFLELAKKRYSLRNFQNIEVEREKLIYVLEAAILAPSAVNRQPLHYIVVSEEEKKNKILNSYSREWMMNAPTIIVVCLDYSKSWKRKDGKDHGDIDAGIAIEHIALSATDQGLGTCIVCNFDLDLLNKTLELPADMEPVALIPIGYPVDEVIPDKKRNSLTDMVTWEE